VPLSARAAYVWPFKIAIKGA